MLLKAFHSMNFTLTCGHIMIDILALSASYVVDANFGTADRHASLLVHHQSFHSQMGLPHESDQRITVVLPFLCKFAFVRVLVAAKLEG